MDVNARTIFDLNAEWARMIEARDIDGIVNLYRPDGAFLLTGHPPFEGQDAVRGAWKFLFELPGFSLTLKPSSVEVSDDASLAMDRGAYRLSYNGPEELVVQTGNYVLVWRKNDNGDWKTVIDIVNSD